MFEICQFFALISRKTRIFSLKCAAIFTTFNRFRFQFSLIPMAAIHSSNLLRSFLSNPFRKKRIIFFFCKNEYTDISVKETVQRANYANQNLFRAKRALKCPRLDLFRASVLARDSLWFCFIFQF